MVDIDGVGFTTKTSGKCNPEVSCVFAAEILFTIDFYRRMMYNINSYISSK